MPTLAVTAIPTAGDPQEVFGAGTLVPQQTAMKTEHGARGGLAWPEAQRKKIGKSALRGSLSLDNGGPHKGSAGLRLRAPPQAPVHWHAASGTPAPRLASGPLQPDSHSRPAEILLASLSRVIGRG